MINDKIIAGCFIFVSLSIGLGFIYSQCVAMPKELRGGVLKKFETIGALYQENNDIIRGLGEEFKKMSEREQDLLERLDKITKILHKNGILMQD